jgi:hypothetical protein
MRGQATSSRCFGQAATNKERENSDTKDAERSRRCRGWEGWTAVRTPCGRGIGPQKRGRGIQDDKAVVDYRYLRNNLSRKVRPFRRWATRPARLRGQHRALGLNRWVIHGGVMVHHSWRAVGRLAATALTFRSRMPFTHQCANPDRTDNPGQQNREENYRNCGSLQHFLKLYLRPNEMHKRGRGVSPHSCEAFNDVNRDA